MFCYAKTKAKTTWAVTADMLSHDAAHVIHAIKALDSLVCTCVLMIVSHETVMVMLIQFCGTFPDIQIKCHIKANTKGLSDTRHPGHP